MIEHLLCHELRVKGSGGSLSKMRSKLVCEFLRAIEIKAEAAAGPEQSFGEPLQVTKICC